MNQGERDELIIQIKLIELRDRKLVFNGMQISSVGFANKEYGILPTNFNIDDLLNMNDTDLLDFSNYLGIKKSPGGAKADAYINGDGYSLKSNNSAPPALVNHTTRPGFERVANIVNVDISILDRIIDNYWTLRKSGNIKEDILNSNPLSPFYNYKEELRPVLNYFLFKGSGSKLSKYQADYILSVVNPLDVNTWKIYDESNALDIIWDKLIFSLRASKGMPSGYPDNLSIKMQPLKTSIDKWTELSSNKYRGALHIRAKK